MNPRAVTVSEFNRYVKKYIEHNKTLSEFYIEGEISTFNQAPSGHLYFNLKDEKNQISCLMFRGEASRLRFQPENGQQVICLARAGYYEVTGQFQIYIKHMEPMGLGNLYAAYEALKKKLEKEGLFQMERKKPIPLIPKRVGVVTSPTGAVIQDIINVSTRRYPGCDILLFPTMVQGAEAVPQLRRAFNQAIHYPGIELVIIGRGGGSMEDLWCFNDEGLARDIAASPIPVISAVGHETDFTICDFVADQRVPTPSAAAELAYPKKVDLQERIAELKARSKRALMRGNEMRQLRLNQITSRPSLSDPLRAIELRCQKAQQLERRLGLALMAPVREGEKQRRVLSNRMENALRKGLERRHRTLGQNCAKLHSLSPLKVLARGYAYVTDESERVIRSIDQVAVGDSLRLRVSDGSLSCCVEDREALPLVHDEIEEAPGAVLFRSPL